MHEFSAQTLDQHAHRVGFDFEHRAGASQKGLGLNGRLHGEMITTRSPERLAVGGGSALRSAPRQPSARVLQ
ncbi:MAG TPA: hypothetical protein VJS42_07265 [Steroidobacteraceae bacterium]|nr:hypothetical protein [Steroidobacteraceae bacterium]